MISEAQIRPRTVHLGRPSMARFLIIDGDAKWRGMLRLALEADGHCIEDAETGAAGLQAFRARRHDLVMCDVTEPEQDGLETIDRLLAERPAARIIAMCAGPGDRPMEILATAAKMGVQAILRKPIAVDQLIFTVLNLLDGIDDAV